METDASGGRHRFRSTHEISTIVSLRPAYNIRIVKTQFAGTIKSHRRRRRRRW